LLIEINTHSAYPIYEQLRDQIVLGIAGSQLAAGEGLPSVRRLAADLGINLHTVNKAYLALCGEGYIVMDRRRGATVALTVMDDSAFHAALSRRLVLAAAEAQCRRISHKDFLMECRDCYRQAGESLNHDKEGLL